MNRIAELRRKHNLSQTELSKKLGIAQNTLSQYENELRIPSSRIILTLSDLFGVSPNYILGEPEIEQPKSRSTQDVTKVLQETNINRVNLYLRKGWRLIHVGEDKNIEYDGAGYSTITYTLGWFDNPKSPAASPLPSNYSNEDEEEYLLFRYHKMCRDRKTGEEIYVGYDSPENEPPDVIDYYDK